MHPYNLLANAVILYLNGKAHTVDNTHPNYALVRQSIKDKKWAGLEDLVNIPKAIVKASRGLVDAINGEVRYNGNAVNSYLASRIIELMSQGFDVQPWDNFMDKLYRNPSKTAVDELYLFLEQAKLPICPDGDFLAYKYVNKNYKDCHSGKFDNSVGQKPTMPRNEVDDNRNRTCSAGLHFCSKGYLPQTTQEGSYRIMIVKVNPADVVSIPSDHNNEKARTWTYEVVGELDEDYSIMDMEAQAVLSPPRNTAQINTNKAKVHRALEDKIVSYINRHKRDCIIVDCDITVRQVAHALKVTNADIVANAGGKFFIYNASSLGSPALSNKRVKTKAKYKTEGL